MDQRILDRYHHVRGRFETLFTAALMALDDPILIEIVNENRRIFMLKHPLIIEILRLVETVRNIRGEAGARPAAAPDTEEKAISFLRDMSPLKADLKAIESRCTELKGDDYLEEALRKLQREIHAASGTVADKGRKACKFIFERANGIFHSYKSTPAAITHLDQIMAQREALQRYAGIFETVGDEDRKNRIEGFISVMDSAVQSLQDEIHRQKEHEARLTEQQQQEAAECHERFLEIKRLYSQGHFTAESQKKNAGAQLKKYRDTLLAHGQRMMARDIDRFINSTGIGKPPVHASAHEDGFDYKKGFMILLPITIGLLLLVFLMIVL